MDGANGRGRVLAVGAAAVAVLGFVVAATVVADRDAALSSPSYERYFRTDAGIPAEYQSLIVEAGTACPEHEHVTPLLVAAILKAESDFDPHLSDPAVDEYGIARWTQTMLRENLPAGERAELPAPPFPPETSIPAAGALLCTLASAPGAGSDPRGPEIGLALGFRASIRYGRVVGAEAGWSGDVEYTGRVERALAAYRRE